MSSSSLNSNSNLNSTKRKIRSPKIHVSNDYSLKEICKQLNNLTNNQQKYVSDFLFNDQELNDNFRYDEKMFLIILYRDKLNYINIKKIKEKIDKSLNLTVQIDDRNDRKLIFKIIDKQSDDLMINNEYLDKNDKENIKLNHIKKENEIKKELIVYQDKSINDHQITKSTFKKLNTNKKLDHINDYSTTTTASFVTNKSLCNITSDNDYLLLPDSNSTVNYFDIDLASNNTDLKMNSVQILEPNELQQSKIDDLDEIDKYYQSLTKDDLLNLLKSKNNKLYDLENEIKNQQIQIDNLKSNCTSMKEQLNDNDNLIKNKENEFKRLEIQLKYAEDTIDLERKTKDLYYKELCKLDKLDNELKCANCSINKLIQLDPKDQNIDQNKSNKHFLEDDPLITELIKSKKRKHCN